MKREPQTAQERAVLLLRATLLPGWHPTVGQRLVWAIRGAIVLGVLVLMASAVDKTLWAWLNLLIVPAVLAIGGYLFSSSQNRATQAATERRTQDEALQAYLDRMTELLLDRCLRQSREDEDVSTVAWARTKTVLRRIDGTRRGIVVRFVYESGLIYKGKRVFGLAEASLRGADLRESWLENIDLEGTDLRDADLSDAHLYGAKLRGANLRGATLRGVDLTGVDLGVAEETNQAADLTGADLSEANLSGATITQEQLAKAASLEGATMPDGSKHP